MDKTAVNICLFAALVAAIAIAWAIAAEMQYRDAAAENAELKRVVQSVNYQRYLELRE